MSKVTPKQQLMYLKGMTERLDVIHEAQIVQLRNYPILIPNIKKAEMEINIDQRKITYDCESKTKTFKKTKKTLIAIENIMNWIKVIVWDSTIVEIKVNGKSVYDSRI